MTIRLFEASGHESRPTPRPGMGPRNSATRVKAFCVGQAKSGTTSLWTVIDTKLST